MTLLHILQPISSLFPRVSEPRQYISNQDKVLYTAITMFIYLVCCQIPLYGLSRNEGNDPFYWMRVILGSNKGTLMELGLSPVITAGWIMQFACNTGLVAADHSTQQGRELYEGTEKLLAMLMALGQALGWVYSGMYGTIDQIGYGNALLIIIQLTASGFLVILLDEMLQKGYGLGSGISLFIAVNICENIFWQILSPVTNRSEFGTEFEGSLVALIHGLISKSSISSALYQAFYRTSAPNLSSLVSTCLIFLLVIYLHGFRVELRLIHKNHKGYERRFPIKLFYTSTMSVICQSFFVSNIYMLSRMLYNRFRDSWWIGILGTWQETSGTGAPVGGFAYWISPPPDFVSFVVEPLHSFVYVVFMCASCAFFSRFWIELSRQSPRDLAKRLRSEGYTIQGHQESYVDVYLNKYIPPAATTGGIVVALISILADLMGVIGSGTGILLVVSMAYGYYEKLSRDKPGVGREEIM